MQFFKNFNATIRPCLEKEGLTYKGVECMFNSHYLRYDYKGIMFSFLIFPFKHNEKDYISWLIVENKNNNVIEVKESQYKTTQDITNIAFSFINQMQMNFIDEDDEDDVVFRKGIAL